MTHRLYQHRFEFFLVSLLIILFGSLFFPQQLFEKVMMPLFILLNIASGILMISRKKNLRRFIMALFLVTFLFFMRSMIFGQVDNTSQFIRLGIYFMFYLIVTFEIIKQVWSAPVVNKNVIIGLMCGYISLGLIAFFVFLGIELAVPESFSGMVSDGKIDSLLYYSYITMLTIGYGEIVPVTPVAQKAAILTGLAGQFYIVIITAVVVEKYIRHSIKADK